jgi:hypothetical protein
MRIWRLMRAPMAALATAASLVGARATAAEHDREFYTGEALYQRCAAAPADLDYAARRGACRGYVLGVSDAMQAAQGAQGPASPTICLGAAEADRLVEQVSTYLAGHPESRRFAASDLIGAALKSAYPCP